MQAGECVITTKEYMELLKYKEQGKQLQSELNNEYKETLTRYKAAFTHMYNYMNTSLSRPRDLTLEQHLKNFGFKIITPNRTGTISPDELDIIPYIK